MFSRHPSPLLTFCLAGYDFYARHLQPKWNSLYRSRHDLQSFSHFLRQPPAKTSAKKGTTTRSNTRVVAMQQGDDHASYNGEQQLIRQLNEALGSDDAVEPSVAKFLLEFCNHEVHTAVAFYRAQQHQEEQHSLPRLPLAAPPRYAPDVRGSPHGAPTMSNNGRFAASRRDYFRRGTAQSCRNVAASSSHDFQHVRQPPKRHSSFSATHGRQCYRRSTRVEAAKPFASAMVSSTSPRSVTSLKVLDIAEAPTITTPYPNRSYLAKRHEYHQRGVRDEYALGRARSERDMYHDTRDGVILRRLHTSPSSLPCRKIPPSSTATVATTTRRGLQMKPSATSSLRLARHPHCSRRNRRESSFHSSWKDADDCVFGTDCATIPATRPPTAGSRRSSSARNLGLGSDLLGGNLEKRDSSAKAA